MMDLLQLSVPPAKSAGNGLPRALDHRTPLGASSIVRSVAALSAFQILSSNTRRRELQSSLLPRWTVVLYPRSWFCYVTYQSTFKGLSRGPNKGLFPSAWKRCGASERIHRLPRISVSTPVVGAQGASHALSGKVDRFSQRKRPISHYRTAWGLYIGAYARTSRSLPKSRV